MNGPCLLWRCVQHDQSALTSQVSDPCKWCPGYGGGPVPVPALLDKTWHPPPWTSPGRHMQRGGWVRQAVRTRYQQPLWTNAVTDKGYYFDTQGESWQTPLKKNANLNVSVCCSDIGVCICSHLFGESSEEISSSEKVQDQVQLPFSLECCK